MYVSNYWQAVSQRIRTDLLSRAREFHLELDDVSITHLSFGKEYTAAVEAKQVAQQEAERAKFVVDKAKQEKKSTVIKAQGEAKSAKLIGDAVRDNPGYIQLRRLEARRVVGACYSSTSPRSSVISIIRRRATSLARCPSRLTRSTLTRSRCCST